MMLLVNQTIAAGPLPLVGSLAQTQEKFLGWNIPPDHSSLVHPHWRAYHAPGKLWHIGFALIYFMLMVLSYVGNGCVVWIFTTSKALRTPSNMFVVNLAIFDLIMGLEFPMFIANSFVEYIIGWEIACTAYSVFGGISGMGQAITNAAIAFDRYRTISCPIDGRLTGVQAGILVAITWFWTIPFNVLPATELWGKYVAEGFLTTCSFDYLSENEDTKGFVIAIFIWSYVIPMTLIIYFYSLLLKSIREHERMLREQAKKMNVKSLVTNQGDKERSVEMKIAKVAFTIFFLFLVAWTPYAAVALIGVFGNKELLTPVSSMLPSCFAKTVSCIDPWIYAINHPRYRQELQKRCKWMGINEPSSDAQSAQTEKTKADEA